MIKKNDLPPLNSLPVFVAVMKTKSYTKAAEELFLTHSAVSQSIKKLEAYLGKKLFLTQKRRLIITSIAEQYYRKIEPIMNDIYIATKSFKEQEPNKISINCISTLCANWLIPKIDNMIEAFGDIDIQLITKGSYVDFDNEDIDISIEYGYENEFNNINKHKLADGELILISNNKHQGKTCSQIIAEKKLIYVDDKIRINDYSQWCRHNNISLEHQKKIVFKNSLQAIKACYSDVGFFITDKLLVKEHLKNNLLYTPQQKNYPTGRSYYILAKDSETALFEKIKELLMSFL